MVYVNEGYLGMAPVVKETVSGVINFDGMQTSDFHE